MQGMEGNQFGVDPGAGDALELDLCPGNHAGQTETADGGAQHIGIYFGIADHHTVVRAMQCDLADVVSEGSSTMMVLPVDVIGNGSADGNKARPGRDGKEPSFRQEYVENIGEADATFAAQHACRFVETEDAVEPATVDEFAAGVETRIAVTAAEAKGEQGARRGSLENSRHLVVPRRLVNVGARELRVAPPRKNLLGR